MTGIFNRLESRGLVARSRSGQDRRSVVVALTEAGQRVLDAAPSLLQDRFRDELSKLQRWEQTQLLSSLQRIATMMDAEGIGAARLLGPAFAGASPEAVPVYREDGIVGEEAPPAESPRSDLSDRWSAGS